MARLVLSSSPCVLISVHSGDAPLTQPPILMLRSKRDWEEVLACCPSERGPLGPCGEGTDYKLQGLWEESCVMLWTSEPEQVWSTPFLSYLEVQGPSCNTGTFLWPCWESRELCRNSYLPLRGEAFKGRTQGKKKKKKKPGRATSYSCSKIEVWQR